MKTLPASEKTTVNYAKQQSKTLLKMIASGTMSENDAKEVAQILEKRFPTPKDN